MHVDSQSRTQPVSHAKNGLVHQVQILGLEVSEHVHMTHHVNINPIKVIIPVIGFPFQWPALHWPYGTIDTRVHPAHCDFHDDVIVLQFDWTFLILDLVHQTVFRMRYGLGMRLMDSLEDLSATQYM